MITPSTHSKRFFPVIEKAEGVYCTPPGRMDVLDFTGANQTVILGYKQFKFESVPNLPGKSIWEDKVSKRLGEFTKTKYFRYFKNGSDAVSCALRLARHLIQKDKPRPNDSTRYQMPYRQKIGFLGYGGANNEFAQLVNNNGVPHLENISRIVPTAEGFKPDKEEYEIIVYESRYQSVVNSMVAKYKICDHLKSGVLGLDESTADFDLYGKSLANGYPVAVMTGKDELMEHIDHIFYSTTYGGENTGLEAIWQTLHEFGKVKREYLLKLEFAKQHLPKWQSVSPEKIQKYYKEKGILFNGFWQLMVPHTLEHIADLKDAIQEIGY